MLLLICYGYVGIGMLFSQEKVRPAIDFIDPEDVLESRPRPDNYIDLPAGTIIARDTAKITPMVNGQKMSYTNFEQTYVSVPDSIPGFRIDSIKVKKVDLEDRVIIYCTHEKVVE
ncbi:hypothetical protein CRP01_29705 [Flavilitoribacter nigricans DSM 23189 = NBRC 102662]|uniref:Uncharacterized protein n=2 Tax=Flavilitoribacter TaxID=2762562 RepID=A0A2D0N366_FLAN2|nr:hypothetical protein CRP01_29705 [Flavilitoribacter nigricans DSM 23189 = NBRC 102662]